MKDYKDALIASTEYFNGNELPAKVFCDKYALRAVNGDFLELTPDDMHWRLAREFARIEKKKFQNPLTKEEIYEYFKNFGQIIPQGSPLYGIGNKDKYVSLSNCFVVESPLDSYAGIMKTDQELVQISKRRGGIGLCLDNLRPAGSSTQNSSRTSTGIISFAKRYSDSINEVGQNGRRGALMLSLNVHHPQVIDFAHCKDDEENIKGANISIQLTDEFLTAVKQNEEYEQRWPIDSETPEISRMVSAREVWNDIIHCAWNRAEPGLLFWDRIISESPADCYEFFQTISTNPCSELPLCSNDSCRLLVVNLMAIIDNAFTSKASINYDKLWDLGRIAQRLMDDMIDLELECIARIIKKIKSDPEPDYVKQTELNLWQQIRNKCENGRRTGTGITALGDTLAAAGIKYGTRKSINAVEKIYQTLKMAAYTESVEMAKELEAFPEWDHNLEKHNDFLVRIKEENPLLYRSMKKHGRRNISLLTSAPTGSISTMAGYCVDGDWYFGTTAGIESLFSEDLIRRKKINEGDSESRVDFTDESGVKWQHFNVYHPGVEAWRSASGSKNNEESPYHEACADDIDWTNRVKLQAAAQKHVDHAISSTINLPADVEESVVADIYETAWKAGCKGITVYREGSRAGVLLKVDSLVKHHEAPDRPKRLPCDIHHVTVSGNPYFITVGTLDGEPYEVFAGKNGFLDRKVSTGVIEKLGRPKCYRLILDDSEQTVIQPITICCNSDEEALTRMLSTGLRHGTPIHVMVDQLEKVQGEMNSFAKSIARSLKKYISCGTKSDQTCSECGTKSLVRQEGCLVCQSCGLSACS